MEAAELLGLHGGRLKWACLGHLSEKNNHPDIAIKTHRKIARPTYALHVAGRHSSTETFVV
jgi:hypothetical protein